MIRSEQPAIDLASTDPNDLRSLDFARRKWFPKSDSNKPVSTATLYRWIRKGAAGVKLQVLRTTGKTYTSQVAVREFLRAVDAAKKAESTELPAATEQELRSAGLR